VRRLDLPTGEVNLCPDSNTVFPQIAEGSTEGFGDTSTLADPTIVDALVAGRQ